MYRHILVPTDGSRRALRAARLAATLAWKTRAELTALYVIIEGVPNAFTGERTYASAALGPEHLPLLREQAKAALEAVAGEAHRAGVRCARVRARARHPWQAILRTARRQRCRLIVMGSHGRDTVEGALLGSQTTQVLAHSKIPVLVCR